VANPQVSVGLLNRLIASVTWAGFSALNVTPSFLNRDGIRLAFEGEATRFLPALTGLVPSPEPYQPCTLTINLLKTQALAQSYEAQRQTQCFLGAGTVRPDATTLGPYDLQSMAIENVRELAFSGEDAGYSVMLRGFYLINNSLWG
jgi:hypothetical protein